MIHVQELLSASLIKRTASALILAPFFLYIIILGDIPLAIWLVLAFALSLYEWYGLSKKTNFFLPSITMGTIYMALSYGSFMALREVYSINVLLLFLAMIWTSDIGAYFVGKIIGGPKLIEEISPNKTWAGFWGALFFPALIAVIWISVIGFHMEFDHNAPYILYPMAVILGVVTGCVGQVGDLLVSFVKRQAKVKDTGKLIPGHGGLLDRIDSMLLGAPVFLILLTLLSYVL